MSDGDYSASSLDDSDDSDDYVDDSDDYVDDYQLKKINKRKKRKRSKTTTKAAAVTAAAVVSMSCVIGLTAVTSVEAARKIPDFAAFASPATPDRKKASKKWAIVSPSPAKKAVGRSKKVDITESFGALTAANLTSLKDQNIEIHTLILGTHPSVSSLSRDQYYAHPMK